MMVARIALAICLVQSSGCVSTGELGSQNRPFLSVNEYKTVNPGFSTGRWTLFFGFESDLIGEPIEAFLRLYARRDDRIISIDCPEDMAKLEGIEIKTEQEALAFLKLFTDIETYDYFKSPHAIGLSKKAVLEPSHGRSLLDPGVSLEIPISTVTRTEKGYLINRTVLSIQSYVSGYPVSIVTELVGLHGNYNLIEKNNLVILDSDQVRLPIIE